MPEPNCLMCPTFWIIKDVHELSLQLLNDLFMGKDSREAIVVSEMYHGITIKCVVDLCVDDLCVEWC